MVLAGKATYGLRGPGIERQVFTQKGRERGKRGAVSWKPQGGRELCHSRRKPSGFMRDCGTWKRGKSAGYRNRGGGMF